MALDKISRPALPYTPAKLPFYDRYSALGARPPTADQFDSDFNALVDTMNRIIEALNQTIAGMFPGSADLVNANKLIMTDGTGSVFWTFIHSKNLSENIIQSIHLQKEAVTSLKIAPQAVGTLQIEDGSVTDAKIALNSLYGSKIVKGSLPIIKLATPLSSSVIASTTDNLGSWYELALENYQIASKKKDSNAITALSLDVIWNNTAGSNFEGGKIKPASLDGSVLKANQSVPLASLRSGGYAGVMCANDENYTYEDVQLKSL
jgi:hypothetical protein